MLHIWGEKESPYKYRLYDMVKDLELSGNVFFHGFEKDTEKIYHEMDVLLMFSKMEGFGRVTVEAMQRGIPVIGFDSGGTSELVKNGYNGFLFRTKDDFLRVVDRLFESNEIYNKICYQAYIDAHGNYTENVYASRVYNFVKQICSSNSGR